MQPIQHQQSERQKICRCRMIDVRLNIIMPENGKGSAREHQLKYYDQSLLLSHDFLSIAGNAIQIHLKTIHAGIVFRLIVVFLTTSEITASLSTRNVTGRTSFTVSYK